MLTFRLGDDGNLEKAGSEALLGDVQGKVVTYQKTGKLSQTKGIQQIEALGAAVFGHTNFRILSGVVSPPPPGPELYTEVDLFVGTS